MSQNIVLWALMVKFLEEVGYCEKRRVVSSFRKFVKTQSISKKIWRKRDIEKVLKSGVFMTFTMPGDHRMFYALRDTEISKKDVGCVHE